jgi:hypothetical protein
LGSNPVNLGLRFLLELAALAALGVWGWHTGEGWLRFVLAIGVPLVAAALWGIFRVPNDPGNAVVAVPGVARLGLELVYFSLAVWGLFEAGYTSFAWILGITTGIHYLISYDRIVWLVRQ